VNRFRQLQPWVQPYAQYLYDVALYNGMSPVVTSTYRSDQRQAVLYERWKRGLSDLPAAPPGKSLHNHGLAFDLVADRGAGYNSVQQRQLGAFWSSMGGGWFESDPVHFQV